MNHPARRTHQDRRFNRRVALDQTRIRINNLLLEFPIVDISTNGLAFQSLRCRFNAGTRLGASVHLYGLSLSENVVVDVTRCENGVVGCRLVDPFCFCDTISRVIARVPA